MDEIVTANERAELMANLAIQVALSRQPKAPTTCREAFLLASMLAYPASPDVGAPKWEFRVVSLNKWSASWGRYKSQVPHTPDLPVGHISWISMQPLSQPQVAGWNSSWRRSIAHMIRAFLLATATIARFAPRRSRSALIHWLNGSLRLAATRTTALAP
ncbi:hypothetical protein amb0932 [Paramagnetospirillum magneticum AMB-1]|uniref:Uncharacterized protein n=1 Tax=Paramagnetospirillum magneticum (strain ATCC 700264 / AMB-1) TaxID=342108 RepID=Q2W8T9_PARM1|nr:hypothetical protein amb0932 [Paramagnetospirillum magneticum AMB-1]